MQRLTRHVSVMRMTNRRRRDASPPAHINIWPWQIVTTGSDFFWLRTHKSVWRPGTTPASRKSLQRSPRSHSWIRFATGKGRKGSTRGKREAIIPPGHRRPSVWPHHTSVTAAALAALCLRSRGSYTSVSLERLPRTSQTTVAFCRTLVVAHCGPIPMTCGSCSCREHITQEAAAIAEWPRDASCQ